MAEEGPKAQIEIGGIKFTGGKAMVVATALFSAIGSLYGAFEVYKDYGDMKKKIQSYEAPDLSEINNKINVIEERLTAVEKSVTESNDYIRDIRKDLKSDLQTTIRIVDDIEKRNKETEREVRSVTYSLEKDVNVRLKDMEHDVNTKMKEVEHNINEKLQKAFDNPLAGK